MPTGVVSKEGYQLLTSPTIKRLLEPIQTMKSMLSSGLTTNGDRCKEDLDKSQLVAKAYMLVLMLTQMFISGSMVSGEI